MYSFFFYLITFFSTTVHFVFQADLKERYTVNELLADLAGCKATRVLLFVDQSYSGVLFKRLRGSQKHLNVVLIQGQAWQSHSHQRLNPFWEDSDWSYIKPATCLLDYFGKVPSIEDNFISQLLFSCCWCCFPTLMLLGPTDVSPSGTVGQPLKCDVGRCPLQHHSTSDRWRDEARVPGLSKSTNCTLAPQTPKDQLRQTAGVASIMYTYVEL